MQTTILGLLAETFIHPGSERSLGVVDLPVAREAATDYPFIPGSGLKGSLRDTMEQRHRSPRQASTSDKDHLIERVFGASDRAGGLFVSDARIALLPIRSFDGPYAWVTCPFVAERLRRDLIRSGLIPPPGFDGPPAGQVLVTRSAPHAETTMILEERSFDRRATEKLNDFVTALQQLIGDRSAKERLPRQLVVVPDEDFAWFARFGLAVTARNVLHDDTKTSVNLWYEETLRLMQNTVSREHPRRSET